MLLIPSIPALETPRRMGFNLGINVGAAAGQTVPHLHVQLIPRTAGDVADPRGGVRWVLPALADYWSGRLAEALG